MPFELENNLKEIEQNLDWVYAQEYEGDENQATEALFKWFFFSNASVQRLFLSNICHVRARSLPWNKLLLQHRGHRGVPDAALHMADGSKLLFEIKITQRSVSRGQLKRHLRDAGFKPQGVPKNRLPKLILITPDFREPPKLKSLPDEYREAIEWVPWNEIMHFLTRLRGLNSAGRLLSKALLAFLKEWVELKRYSA